MVKREYIQAFQKHFSFKAFSLWTLQTSLEGERHSTRAREQTMKNLLRLAVAVLGLNFVQIGDGQIDVAAYVPHEQFAVVSVIDTGTNTLLGNRISVGAYPYGTAMAPDGKSAYVANFNGGTVSVIDTATNTVPFGVAVTPDGKHAYCANRNDGTVSVINTLTNTVVGPL